MRICMCFCARARVFRAYIYGFLLCMCECVCVFVCARVPHLWFLTWIQTEKALYIFSFLTHVAFYGIVCETICEKYAKCYANRIRNVKIMRNEWGKMI